MTGYAQDTWLLSLKESYYFHLSINHWHIDIWFQAELASAHANSDDIFVLDAKWQRALNLTQTFGFISVLSKVVLNKLKPVLSESVFVDLLVFPLEGLSHTINQRMRVIFQIVVGTN